MKTNNEWCLLKEPGLRRLARVSQKSVLIEYKGFTREEPLRFDVLVEGCVLVEAKAVENILPIHKAELLSYMKLLDVPLGLLIDFHEMKVTARALMRRFEQSIRDRSTFSLSPLTTELFGNKIISS